MLLGILVTVRAIPRLAERSGIAFHSYASFLLLTTVLYLIGRYANIAFTAYLTTKGYRVVDDVEAVSPEEALRIFGESRAVLRPSPAAIEEKTISGPTGLCPNCDTEIPVSAAECVRCKVQFGPGRAWQIKSMKST